MDDGLTADLLDEVLGDEWSWSWKAIVATRADNLTLARRAKLLLLLGQQHALGDLESGLRSLCSP